MTRFDALLEVQALDTTIDQLRHERAVLPEREERTGLERQCQEIEARLEAALEARDGELAQEKRLADEAATLESKARAAEEKLYSGSVTAPKELEALQADVASLRRHESEVEDRELEVMERREAADAEVAAIETERAAVVARLEAVRTALDEREDVLDARIAEAASARGVAVAAIEPALVEEYERRRAQAHGIGVARLVGASCQGCHIALPATELDRIRHGDPEALNTCENCGCILVVAT